MTASHRAEARSLRKLPLHCPCCWVTVSAPHMTPNDNNKLHPKMLNGAGIAARWSCCLCLSVWAPEQGSLHTHLTPSQSFHGVWTRVPFPSGWSQDAPLSPLGLLTTAGGKDQGDALVAPFGAPQLGPGTLCMGAHLTSLQRGIHCGVACEGVQGSHPP